MKTLNKIFLSLGVVAAAFSFSSCTGDLDQLPTDPNSLTNADFKKNPEKYKGLVVRVAGYSALFTTLSKSLQDDIINRTEQGM